MQHVIFDTEIVGEENPVFLIGATVFETGVRRSFWLHEEKQIERFRKMIGNPNYTWVGFNSENFDRPLIAAALMGCDAHDIKRVATAIIRDEMRSWQTYKEFGIDFIEYDHIDLIEVAPGVMISLKTYAGRMGYKTMVDMPFHHDQDLTPEQLPVLRKYCFNDLGVTKELFCELKEQLALRKEMTETYGIDLRSKSDAQIAEAILKSQVGMGKAKKEIPSLVTYSMPDIIKTRNSGLLELITRLEACSFKINYANGSPELPDFLNDEYVFGKGTYQVGLGGLHSTHDKGLYLEATDDFIISDFDVASYYPNIMLKAGMTPRLPGWQGEKFIEEYRTIYDMRMAAKRSGNKAVANALKIVLNGTFGKLGSIYCPFYSPDLMLAVTLTGQLNLLTLIVELDKLKDVKCQSANTDGIIVTYPPKMRDDVLTVFSRNAKRTGFEYEETRYTKVGMKDVNNYLALGTDGKVKRKGLYGESGVHSPGTPGGKNPTMEVCTLLAIDFLKTGSFDILKYTDMKDFVAIRNVKGGGIQFDKYEYVDDWVEIEPRQWSYEGMTTKPVSRKSRPPPHEVGRGGVPFGRVARWYMTTKKMPPLSYIGSGNRVPKTEGARVCMTLPKTLPKDLDLEWYLAETNAILTAIGVKT